jgi:hypothetical protein
MCHFLQLYMKKYLRKIDGNIFMEVPSSLIFSKRTFGVFYLCVLLIFANIIIKYVINLVIAFCVIYTTTDLYKNRKRYWWIIRFINGNVNFILCTIIGEDTINNFLYATPKKVTRRTSKKN